MTRQLRRSRDNAARKRRQVSKLVREGTGHLSSQEKRELRLAGRPERIERHMLDQDLKVEMMNVEAEVVPGSGAAIH